MLNLSLKKVVYACSPRFLHRFVRRVEKSEIGSRLASGAFWSLFGAVVSQLLVFTSFVIVARILGKVGYGRFGIVQSTVGMFGVFAGFGLGLTASKHVAEFRKVDPARAGRIMGMAGMVAAVSGILMAAVLFVFAPWLAARTLADPGLAPLLRIGSVILLIEAMNGAQTGAMAGFEAFKATAKISMWVGLASFPMMILGVYLGGLPGSVWALAANRAFSWFLNHLALRREASRAGVPFSWRGSRQELAVLWGFSLPSMLAGVMFTPTVWICNAMLVNQPGGYGQMGILQANRSFQQALMFIGAMLGAPLLPMLANLIGSGQKSERLARVNMLSTWSLGILPALLLISIPEIGRAAFGKGYAGRDFTNTYLLVLVGASIMSYRHGLARALSAHNMMWWAMLTYLVWGVTMIGLMLLFLSKGAVGYSLAWTVSYALNTVIFIPLFTRKNLVPKGTIVSLEAGLIWLILLTAVTLSFAQAPLVWRLVSCPVLAAAACALFWRLLKT